MDELAPPRRFDLSIAENCSCSDHFLHNAAARYGAGKLQKLIELDIFSVYLYLCQCVLTGVTT